MWRCATRRFLVSTRNGVFSSPASDSLRLDLKHFAGINARADQKSWFHRCFPTEAAFSEKNDVGSSTYGKQVVNSNVPVEGMPKVVLSDDVDHEFGIATGLELKELVAEKEGIKLFDYLDPPSGPFGTKEQPAIVQSRYDERIVGCSGGVAEDEHDVVWFKLKKGELYECTVCTQVFQLEVVGSGSPPGGHHH